MLEATRLLWRMAMLWWSGPRADPTPDYDHAAPTYDAYYGAHLGQAAQQLLNRLPTQPNTQVLDLACGTGFFTRPLAAAVGPLGHVTAVDLSGAMLAVNRQRAAEAGLTNVSFVQADALAVLEALPAQSMNGVVCGWGLCYMDAVRFREAVERAVKPGGFVGLIENRASSLSAVQGLFRRVMLRNGQALVKHVQLQLPRGQLQLRRTLCKRALRPVHAWDGSVTLPCQTGRQITEYLQRSGAAAGFLDALHPHKREHVLRLLAHEADRLFQRGEPVAVVHEFCGLLAVRT